MYFEKEHFKEFLKANHVDIKNDVGYMFVTLDKENSFYHPGETVKGTIFMEIFGECSSNELWLQIDGEQIAPQQAMSLFNDKAPEQESLESENVLITPQKDSKREQRLSLIGKKRNSSITEQQSENEMSSRILPSPKNQNPMNEPEPIANAFIQNKILEKKYKNMNLNHSKPSHF